jgi:hypothetical protein
MDGIVCVCLTLGATPCSPLALCNIRPYNDIESFPINLCEIRWRGKIRESKDKGRGQVKDTESTCTVPPKKIVEGDKVDEEY